MVNRLFGVSVATGFVVAAAAGLSAHMQEPRPQGTSSAVATVEGCLYKEVDVPGRHVPDAMRSRTVTDEDYVIAKAKVVKGSAPAARAEGTAGQTAGQSGPADEMYKVKGSNLKLGDHAGHRVQVDGTFDHQERSGKPTTFAYDLVILNGTALRELPGECPKDTDK